MNPLDVINPKKDASGGLKKILETTGRFPPIEIFIRPLDPKRRPFSLNRFLSYQFDSSVVVPVDTFSFRFVAPDDPRPIDEIVQEGDIVVLRGNGIDFCTGIIDVVDVETDKDNGETVSLMGRNLLSQLEDNDALSLTTGPIHADNYTPAQVVKAITEHTRIQSEAIFRDAPVGSYLFATEPSETKLAAIQRYLDPLNCLLWSSPTGRIIIGRPNMSQKETGRLFLSKAKRQSNVISIKSTSQGTKTTNVVAPVWSGQEMVVNRTGPESALHNSFPNPTRLYKLGHLVIKTVVVSTPQGTSAQELSEVNRLQAGGQNLLQAHAKKEIARSNMNGQQVQVVVPGHYDLKGNPFVPDTVFKIEYDRHSIDRRMYLYDVQYIGGEDQSGQHTVLRFCDLGTIVSDVRAQ